MPSMSFAVCREKQAKNFKQSKDRVNTVDMCMLTHQYVVIDTDIKATDFNYMDISTLPVHYYKQANAWIDAIVFESWLHVFYLSM